MSRVAVRSCGAGSTSRLVYAPSSSSKAGLVQLVLHDHVHSLSTYHTLSPGKQTRRSISSTSRIARPPASTLTPPPSLTSPSIPPPQAQAAPTPTTSALAQLPLTSVLRTYAITSLSARPLLLAGTTRLLLRMLDSHSLLFSIHRNPLLRFLLKKTFYAQFCAGENADEVRSFVKRMEKVGYSGVALEYASEVLEDESEEVDGVKEEEAIERWERGILESIEMSREGSFVAFKYSGMCPSALRLLKSNSPPTPRMSAALTHICDAALARNIRVSPAAEPQNAQRAVNDWTLHLARKYNRPQPSAVQSESIAPPAALIYNTYQTYLKSAPRTLLSDLHLAEREGFTLGVKLVRGAYLATEQRDLIHDSKQDTDDAYDGLAASLLRERFEGPLAFVPPAPAEDEEFRRGEVVGKGMERVDVLLASHNMRTVELALAVRAERLSAAAAEAEEAERGHTVDDVNEATPSSPSRFPPIGDLSFAQLQGMADEVSCALLAAQSTSSHTPTSSPSAKPQHQTYTRGPAPHVYKYCNWGTLPETLAYLLRRAAENGDAVSRTSGTAGAMRGEMGRRLRAAVGLRG